MSLSSLAISKLFDIFKPRPIEILLSRNIKKVHNRISIEDKNFKRNKLSNEYHALKPRNQVIPKCAISGFYS